MRPVAPMMSFSSVYHAYRKPGVLLSGGLGTMKSTSSAAIDEPPSCPVDLLEQRQPELSQGATATFQKETDNWNDWRWQIRNRIRTIEQLGDYFPRLRQCSVLAKVIEKFPVAITPYYASLVQRPALSDPIFQMCVPQAKELHDPPFLQDDPLGENDDMPVPGLVHRYRDRALLIATTTCATYCRHCTRKRMTGATESSISPTRLRQVVAYLSSHPEIKDVIVSGGDPFTMPTPALERVLMALRHVPSIEIIRIGTRTPVVLPQRITEELTQILRKYHPIWINTHFNHPNELTHEAAEACGRLVDAGFPLGNQSVLLRGVNDDPKVIEQLCRGLVRMRVRPYYLFQCDLVRGVEHFRTPLSRGIEIMDYLRGRVSGLAIPNFVVDAPDGGGKIPLLPNYIVSSSRNHTVLRNYEGMLLTYPEPGVYCDPAVDSAEELMPGDVCELATGKGSIIMSQNSACQKRPQEQKNHSPG